MKFDWLEDLIALLDTGSVVEAAASRNISQSAFSRRIQAAENIFNIELINRSAKPNRPSEVVSVHSDELRQLAYMQTQMIKQLQIGGREGAKHIVIAAQHAITTSLGPSLVKRISAIEKTHVRLRSGSRDECEALLLTAQANIALTYWTDLDSGRQNKNLTEEVVVAEDTFIPVFDSSKVDDLLWRFRDGQLDIVAYPADVFLGSEFNRQVLPNLEKVCQVNTVAETALSPAVLQLAAKGVGAAWVPRALAQDKLESGVLTDLSQYFGTVNLIIIAMRLRDRFSPNNGEIWQALTQVTDSA